MAPSLLAPIAAALLQGAAPADSVPLYANLGDHHHRISTSVAAAQRYFDQGLRLVYAFNHAEAIRAFEEAARRDPSCAICHWGAALAYGPNINAPMDSSSGAKAWAHLRQAIALRGRASEAERAYIDALATRYAAVPPANRAGLDSAYARAMRALAERYPADDDAQTLYAEAMMDLRPWAYWTLDGRHEPGTMELVARLETVLARTPNHPGACHYYIHAVEAAQPERAVECAERLASLMPGAGHIVHMPAHIYIRVGRYADAIAANEHAVHTDQTYIAQERPSGVYPIAYYPHNWHFLSFAATMAGRRELAIQAAREVVRAVPPEVARQAPPVEPLVPFAHITLATFGAWKEVLAEPMPPADLRFATAMAQYARGLALGATGRFADADAALDTVRAIAAATPAGDNRTVLRIATHALAGDVAMRRGDFAGAERELRAAVRLEDGLMYIEPPLWPQPVRHSLGAVLLLAGRPEEAEVLYREDLRRFPENGWALRGLARSLASQGRAVEAEAAERRFARAWGSQGAAPLLSSRFE